MRHPQITFDIIGVLKLFQAFKLGMYGADYAWILHETIGPPWWKQSTVDCSQSNMAEAAQNVLVVSSHNSIVGGETSYSGLVNQSDEIFNMSN